MNATTRWFGWLVVILPLHMLEQMAFGLDELARLRQVLGIYFGWFVEPDYGVVLLVTIVATLVNYLVYLILRGGTGRRIALTVFGILGVGELHHLLETAVALRYTPGTLTAVPYVIFGVLLLLAVRHEPLVVEAA